MVRRLMHLRRRIIDIQIHSVGIDLGKTTFHLVALGAAGNVPRQMQLLGLLNFVLQFI